VHRGCDFAEVSGTSIGALNSALIAQAARTGDRAQSLANLRAAAEDLVAQWASIRSTRDVMRARPLGRARLALFGLDSIEDFEPLHEFVRTHVALDRLAAGRELRVGTLTLNDGRYREIAINRGGSVDPATAHEFIFGSAIVPVFGRPLLLTPPGASAPMQLGDGGMRHAVPVSSYFQRCASTASHDTGPCIPVTGADTPQHPRIEQLFVVITNPYERNADRPAGDADIEPIEDGRQLLAKLGSLLVDRLHRSDLDDALLYNDLLAWQALSPRSPGTPAFPLGSFNREGEDGPKPYKIAVIAPQLTNADPLSIFDVDPATQRRQMFCGCIAADDVMQTQFGLARLSERCATRFPALPEKRRHAEAAALTPAFCSAEPAADR